MTELAKILDVRGMNCPLPVLKAKKAMRELVAGELLWVETTDPLSAIDIPAFCENDGHQLCRSEVVGGYQRYLICKDGLAGKSIAR
jgi:tRNA 2-thiouridine synthesizing protein A